MFYRQVVFPVVVLLSRVPDRRGPVPCVVLLPLEKGGDHPHVPSVLRWVTVGILRSCVQELSWESLIGRDVTVCSVDSGSLRSADTFLGVINNLVSEIRC